jgi:hypothetical protein
VKPADIFEEMWVGDIVGLEWDILRYRRLKARLMDATSHKGLRAVLPPHSFAAGWWDLVDQWAARATAAIEQVDHLLESAGLTQHTVMAETLRQNLDHIAQIELMTARAQVSRNCPARDRAASRNAWAKFAPRGPTNRGCRISNHRRRRHGPE